MSHSANRAKHWILFVWAALILLWGILHICSIFPTHLLSMPDGCFIKQITGFSCWACGGTRMADSLISLHVLDAFRYNPFFMILLCWAIGYLIYLTIRAFRNQPIHPPKFHWWYLAAPIGLIVFTLLRNTDWYLQFFYI